MFRDYNEIRKINLKNIKNEEDFKRNFKISEEEWKMLIDLSQDYSDENTPKGFKKQRIELDVMNKGKNDTLEIDLIYSIKNEEINKEEEYYSYDLDELKGIIAYEL